MAKREGDPGYSGTWCIHYRFNRNVMRMADGTCCAGVRYGDIAGEEPGAMRRLPCFLGPNLKPKEADAVACSSFRAPTPEEVRLHEEWIEGRMGLLTKVMTAIKPWRDAHKGKAASEVVECPGCAGRLHLSIAAYNGHVHGNCETKGCVSWME